LVRHGQARSFEPDHALTATGEAQVHTLAHYWLKHRVTFDEVYSGSLARQVRTGQIVAECFCGAGVPWPAAVRDPSWNEYDAGGVLAQLANEPEFAALAAGYEAARGGPEENRRFQRLLEAGMLRWLDGSLAGRHVESWPAFRDRLTGAIQRLREGPPGRRIVVFTSGGPIGFTTHFAMQAPARAFLDINWRVRNASLTHFVFDRDRFTLDSFNSVPHLDDRGLWTYR
jgi:broad specificity phosphatase PhoE